MPSSSVLFPGDDDPQPISFAPNMTEASFNNQDELFCTEADLLFPPVDIDSIDADGSVVSKRSHHSKKKDKGHIPRPPNAFILFRSSFVKQQHIPGSIEGNHSQLSKIVGACWQRLSYEERQVWERKAKAARAEHKRLYPDYRFVRSRNPSSKTTAKEKPPPKFVNTIAVVEPSTTNGITSPVMTMITTQSPTRSPRRRIVGNKSSEDPRRCEQIARLLVAGHKGSSLEALVQQFDAQTAELKKTATSFEAEELPRADRAPASRGSVVRAPVIRRSSSCPPPEMPVASTLKFSHPQTSQAPSRRPKPLRGVSTAPYPLSCAKHSRSVSPPVSPAYRDVFDSTPPASAIEGPFAHSTFDFVSPTVSHFSRRESIAPNDIRFFDLPSPSPTVTQSFYQWPIPSASPSPIQPADSFYPSFSSNMPTTTASNLTSSYGFPQPLSAQSSQSDVDVFSALRGGVEPEDWCSDFDWIPNAEDETGSSTAPPSTPDGSSPVVAFSRGLPTDENSISKQPIGYDAIDGLANISVDLNNYSKGLQLFTTPLTPIFSPQSITSPTSTGFASLSLDNVPSPCESTHSKNIGSGIDIPDMVSMWAMSQYMQPSNEAVPGQYDY